MSAEDEEKYFKELNEKITNYIKVRINVRIYNIIIVFIIVEKGCCVRRNDR